jgi:hypothetical protein
MANDSLPLPLLSLSPSPAVYHVYGGQRVAFASGTGDVSSSCVLLSVVGDADESNIRAPALRKPLGI